MSLRTLGFGDCGCGRGDGALGAADPEYGPFNLGSTRVTNVQLFDSPAMTEEGPQRVIAQPGTPVLIGPSPDANPQLVAVQIPPGTKTHLLMPDTESIGEQLVEALPEPSATYYARASSVQVAAVEPAKSGGGAWVLALVAAGGLAIAKRRR